MKNKQFFSVLLALLMLLTPALCVFSSAEKIGSSSDAVSQDAMDMVFGSPEGFDREIRRIILERNNALSLSDLQKMDKTEDGRFAPTNNNLSIVLKACEENSTNTVNSLPSSYDISSKVPLPGNQGNLKSCTSWAFVYAALAAKEVQKRGWTPRLDTHIFSPSHVHNSIVQGNDRTTNYLEVLNYIKDNGVSTIKYFPISGTSCSTQPNTKQLENASLYKGTQHDTVVGVSEMKQQIYNGNVVVLPIYEYSDFVNISWSNQIYDVVSGSSLGTHSIALVGYDNSKGSGGAFKFINSWGTDWGLDGYGWISYTLAVSSTVNMVGTFGYYLNAVAQDNYKLGDIDENGTVTVSDAQAILSYSVGSTTPTARQFVLSDVDGDGSVTVSDSRHVLRYATALISQMPLYD